MDNNTQPQESSSGGSTDSIREIPPPPPSEQFDTLDQMHSFLQNHQRTNGAALVTRRSAGRREINGEKVPKYVTWVCDRGAKRLSRSSGIRKTTSRKQDCPFQVSASATESNGCKWSYKVSGTHNHGPSSDPSSHPIHRRRTKQQRDLELSFTRDRVLTAREMVQLMRDQSTTPTYFCERDIWNDRQHIQAAALNGLTPIQAWLKILDENGLKHKVRYGDGGSIDTVVWTYPWCEEMWKTYSEVLAIEKLYKTNRFKMHLFQIVGMTDMGTVVNFAFGLTNKEKEPSTFNWLLQQLNALRDQIGAPEPRAVVAEKETALKNAVSGVFPVAQQQLCVWRINTDIKTKIRTHWKDDSADLTGLTNDDDDPDAAAEIANARSAALAAAVFQNSPDTREGMFAAWQKVLSAPNEAEFGTAWKSMLDTYGEKQDPILQHILDEYMSRRHQWAQAYITPYRNYGKRISPTEVSCSSLKKALINGTVHLNLLNERIVQMLEEKKQKHMQQKNPSACSSPMATINDGEDVN